MSRRSLIYSLLIACSLFGGLGWWRWQKSGAITTPEVNQHITRHPVASRQLTPPAARLVFLTDLARPYEARIQLLHSTLESECSEPEIRYLYQLLEKGPAAAELPEQGYMIANDIMGQLIHYDTDRIRLATRFTALLNDSQRPAVLRDYAVQFLGRLIDPRKAADLSNSQATSLAPEITAQVMKSLVIAATDPALTQTSVPGTTLMVFVNLARSGEALDCGPSIATLKPWLSQALGEGSTLSLACRVSAVIAAGALAPEDFRATIRKIAYQPDGEGTLQLCALASLGQSGDAADLPKLQHVSTTHPTLAYAALEASRVLTARLSAESPKVSQ
jgi:hypothetical protein